MGDSYRPNRPPRDHAPLADRMTFSSGGGNSYRPEDRPQDGGRNSNNSEFTFSNSHQAPQFPPSGPANGDHRARRQQRGRGGPHSGRDGRRGGDYVPSHGGPRNNAYASRRGRGSYKKPAPHERALLQTRDDTIEQPLGVSDGPNKFRNMADMSDDEEADMDFDSDSPDGDAADNGKHKMARKQSSTAADGNSVPKWSNPDPYTALPPPDETTGKRIDVVKLIRKAKIDAADKVDESNAVAANDDFISFGDDGDNADQPIVLGSDEPPVLWGGSSVGGRSFAGSLNDVSTSGALSAPKRNAKRSAEDAGLPQRPQHPDRSHKRKRPTQSVLAEEWESLPGQSMAPWTAGRDYKHLLTQPNKWLHNEILDFYDSVAPQPHETDLRRGLIERVEAAIGLQQFPPYPAHVQCFGSFPAGLFLPSADMDLVYTSDQYRNGGNAAFSPSKNQLWKIGHKLEQKGVARELVVIPFAKVPIIKFKDQITGLPVDISFENLSGVYAQDYFKKWLDEHEAMLYLVALVKQFLVMRSWNEVSTGGLGGFSTICLVVSYLQLEAKGENYGDLFLGFLDYYGNRFDLNRMRIVMNPPGRHDKGSIGIDGRKEKLDNLSIQDPNRPDNNISGGSYKVRDIFNAFSDAHRELVERMHAISLGTVTGNSILDAVIGGNYDSYKQHRSHMQKQARKYLRK